MFWNKRISLHPPVSLSWDNGLTPAFVCARDCPRSSRSIAGSAVLTLPFFSKSVPPSLQASHPVWARLPMAPCIMCRKRRLSPRSSSVPLGWDGAGGVPLSQYAGELRGLRSSLRGLTLNGLNSSPGVWLQPGSARYGSPSSKWEFPHLM